jgi:hypothetical protein
MLRTGGLLDADRSWRGKRAVGPADSTADIRGSRRVLLSRDSCTLLIVTPPACETCRADVASYAVFARWASIQVTRVLLVDPNVIRRSDGSGDRGLIRAIELSPAWHARFGERDERVTLLLDPHGMVRARWVGDLPTRLAVLRALDAIARPSALTSNAEQ